jgi:hypothetical protein
MLGGHELGVSASVELSKLRDAVDRAAEGASAPACFTL